MSWARRYITIRIRVTLSTRTRVIITHTHTSLNLSTCIRNRTWRLIIYHVIIIICRTMITRSCPIISI